MDHTLELGATVAIAEPLGMAAQGATVSDTTFGATPIGLDLSYVLTARFAIVLAGSYAPTIPTLCESTNSCTSSLGSDTQLAARGRLFLPRVWRTTPRLELGIGYEWLTTKLVDNGASASRSYRGPTLASVELGLPFQLGSRWTLGPFASGSLGVFTHEGLTTDGFRSSTDVSGRVVHGWVHLGARLSVMAL